MYSGHPITYIEMTASRNADILREAAKARLVNSINAGKAPKISTLRHRLGNLLVRSGERLQAASRPIPVDESGGVLHLAR
jgi:hypothetical protein